MEEGREKEEVRATDPVSALRAIVFVQNAETK
jgi:hypothetical protein